MNRFLRKQTTDCPHLEKVKQIKSALNKAELPNDMSLHRGVDINGIRELINLDEALTPDNISKLIEMTLREDGFMSTSILEKSSFNDIKISMIINAPKGTQGAYIGEISQFPNEAEVLLNSGQSMLIKDAKFINSRNIRIQLDIIQQ